MRLLLALALVASTLALDTAAACPDLGCVAPAPPETVCLSTHACVPLDAAIVGWLEDQLGPCTCDPIE